MDLNEKNIFKALNNIQVDISNFENQQIQMDEIQHKNIKTNILKNINEKSSKRNKKIKYASAAAILGGILLTGSMFIINPALADEIPIVNSIISNNNGTNTNYKDYIHSVGKSASCNGVTITLKEIISDDNTIMTGYIIKSEKPIKELFPNDDAIMFEQKFTKINGNLLGSCGELEYEHIDDHTLSFYESNDFSKVTFPSKYKLDLNFKNFGKIKGTWSFNIDMNHEDIKKVSKIFDINKSFQLPTGNINIKTITASPISFKMNLNRLNQKDLSYPEWHAITNKGEELVCKGEFLSDEGDGLCTRYFTPAKEMPSKVTFVNLLRGNSKNSITKTKEMSNLPVVFKSENFGTLTINKVEKLEDKVLVYAHSDSTLPLTLAQQLTLVDKNNTNTDYNSLWTNINQIKYDKTYKDLIIEYSRGFRTARYSKDADYEFSFDTGTNISIDPNFKLELDLKDGH